MTLSVQQVIDMAPDPVSAAAGRKLASPKPWKTLGRNGGAMWGECVGSAVYQVKVDAANLGYKCSCPSRKFPCKHVLGLLLLASGEPAALPESEAPEWVAEWLKSRGERAAKRETQREGPPSEEALAAKARRVEKREGRVIEGIDRLERWMRDLVRQGLAGLESKPFLYWESEAKSLVDAQAPGLAALVRHMSAIPGSGADWPARLAEQLGRTALLTQAYRRLESLDAGQQADLRAFVGWTTTQEELSGSGERVADRWTVIGQYQIEEERLRVQRSWLRGEASGRDALVLQFAAGGAPYPEMIVPGVVMEADIIFYPSACPQRARIAERRGPATPLRARVRGADRIEDFLTAVAESLSRQPLLDRFACVLRDVTPTRTGDEWWVRDTTGAALRLTPREHWTLLALSGGGPLDVAGEWDGHLLLPLAVTVNDRFHVL